MTVCTQPQAVIGSISVFLLQSCMVTAPQRGTLIKFESSSAHFIFNLQWYGHVSIIHREAFNMLRLEDMCRILTTIMMYWVVSFNEPHYLSRMLTFCELSRGGYTFPESERKLEEKRKTFSYFGPALYISLLESLKGGMSLLVVG